MKAKSLFKTNLCKLQGASCKSQATQNRHVTCHLLLATCFLPIAICFLSGALMAQDLNPPLDQWQGRQVFQAKGCAKCHAVYGEGGKIGPDLGERKFYGSYLRLAGIMWNHFPKMYAAMQKAGVSWSEFTDREMSELIAYLLYIRYLGEPGNEYRGKKLLQSKGCIKCHKFGGLGGDVGPDISQIKEYMSPLLLVEALWNHGPQLQEVFEQRKIKRPEFVDNEIVDLAVAIRSYMSPNKVPVEAFSLGDARKGETVVINKGCTSCHSIRGIGGKVGPDFMDLNLDYSLTQIAGQMWNHGPKMWELMKNKGIAVPTFAKGEMADLIAYLYKLKLEDVQGDTAKGREVLDKKQCLSCHSLQGKGLGGSPDLAASARLNAPVEMVTAMWNHAPGMREKIVKEDLQWPEFVDDEMAHLYAYLHSTRYMSPH